MKTGFINKVDPKLIEVMVDYVTRANVPRTSARFAQQGGAIGRVAENATAWAQRDAIHQLAVDADWMAANDGAAGIAHARALWAELEPMTTHGFYPNIVYDEPEER